MTDVRSEEKSCSPAEHSRLESEEQNEEKHLDIQVHNNTDQGISDMKDKGTSYLSAANSSTNDDVRPTLNRVSEQQSVNSDTLSQEAVRENQKKTSREIAQCIARSPISFSKAHKMAVDQEIKQLKQNESVLTTKTVTANSSLNETGNNIFVSESQMVITSSYGAPCISPLKKQQPSNLIPQTVLEHMSDNDEPTESPAGSDMKKNLVEEHNLAICRNDTSSDEIPKTHNSLHVGIQTAEKQSYESDMDCSSDSEDRLVVDNDSVSDETSEEEHLPGNLVKSEASFGANKTEAIHNMLLKTVSMNMTSTSGTFSNSSNFPIQAPTRAVENTSSQSQTVIPSVVNDMTPIVEHTTDFQTTHGNGKTRELKSLPADFRMSYKQVFSAEDSLLKMNKPTMGLHVLQPMHTFGPRPCMLFHESTSASKSGMNEAKDLTPGLESTQRLQLGPYQHDSSDRRDKADNYRIIEPETKLKKEKSISAENPDMNKDSLTSEEQVNAVIKKYHLSNSPEKREVSVKDMRRVIPQLIMCLYSKEDHHARKVKGLWEKKPNNWPSDIPYCDPNNSNRGGDTVGKPKKETLHKMFDYLINQYLQKMRVKNMTSSHIPYSQGSTPHPSSNISNYFVLPQQMSPIRQSNTAQLSPGPSKYSISKSGSFPPAGDGTFTIVGKADLRPLVQQVVSSSHQKQIPAFKDIDKEEHRKDSTKLDINSQLSDTQMASSCRTDQTPAAKRQKTDLDGEKKIISNLGQRNQLPTVVDMHSPVQVDDETDVNNMPNTSLHLAASLTVPNSTCVMSSAKPLSSLQKDTVVFGTSDCVESQSERCTSLPNIALMMSGQNIVIGSDNVRPLQTASDMTPKTTNVPIVSSAQSHILINSLPKPPPFNAQTPSMLTLFSDVTHFLTTQARPGVPIIPMSDLPQFQNSPSSLSGHQQFHSDKTVMISPVHLKDSSKQLYFTNQNAAKKESSSELTENKLPCSHSSQNGSADILPKLGNQTTEIHRGQYDATTDEYSEAKISKHSVISNDKRTTVELKKGDHLRQTQNADLQAASAILMLSTTPVVSCAEKISKSDPPAKPVYADIEGCSEPKTECCSIDSDYYSLPTSSFTDNLYQVTASTASNKELPTQTSVGAAGVDSRRLFMSDLNQQSSAVDCSTSMATSVPITSSQHPLFSPNVRLTDVIPQVVSSMLTSDLPTTSCALSCPVTSSDCLQSVIRTSTNVIFTDSDAHYQIISSSVMPTATVTSGIFPVHDITSQSTASLSRLSCPSIVVSSHHGTTDQIKKHVPLLSSQSETLCKESYTVTSEVETSCDRPLSLVLPHQNIDVKEHFTIDVTTEETKDPMQETMSRIQEKLLIVEKLHQAKKFRERDLSLLLLVLDLLRQKQDSLDEHNRVEFILTCHKLEATFDVAIWEKHIPDSLRQYWRDYQEKNYFEVNRRRSSVIPPTDAHVFHLSTTQ